MGQDKLIPPLAPEAAGIITGSEQILKDYASASSLTARDIKRLIEDVLHNPDFNADDVDTDMLERLANSIDSGDLEIINMHQEGDGAQKLELFKRPAEKVLRELISDIRLAGCQHFAFKEYLDPHGNRLFAGHSNGSVSFQLAQLRIGEGKVPVSLVIYIDATYIKKGIPIRPIYCKSINRSYTISYTICNTISYTIYCYKEICLICCVTNLHFVPVGCLNNDRTVMSKAFAWRPLALLPILKASACAETDKDWLVGRRLDLYHRSMDHIIADLNELCSKDIHLRFADNRIRLSRAFYHVLVLDGAEVATATMCDTRQCPVCTCPHDELDRTTKAYPYRHTEEVKAQVEAARREHLDDRDQMKVNHLSKVLISYTISY